MAESTLLPHQFANADGVVLILKQVDTDGKSYGGFQWPMKIGESVDCPDWNPQPSCGGGLHGWPWGIGIGDGKDPDYAKLWIAFAAKPEDIVDLGGKCKAKCGVIVACGTYLECNLAILKGQIAWTQRGTQGASSNTGYQGASSNTGDQGASSNTGDQGASSNTGYQGASSNTGDRGASSNTGDRGASSNTGDQGASSNTGYQGASSNTGYQGASSNTGDRGASSNTGDRGASSNTGYQGASSNTGYQGAASSTGERGSVVSTGDFSTVECGPTGIIAVCADTCFWKIQAGATLAMKTSKGSYLLQADDWKVSPGEVVCVEHGVMWSDYAFDGYSVS